jgi:hypothetical protein
VFKPIRKATAEALGIDRSELKNVVERALIMTNGTTLALIGPARGELSKKAVAIHRDAMYNASMYRAHRSPIARRTGP